MALPDVPNCNHVDPMELKVVDKLLINIWLFVSKFCEDIPTIIPDVPDVILKSFKLFSVAKDDTPNIFIFPLINAILDDTLDDKMPTMVDTPKRFSSMLGIRGELYVIPNMKSALYFFDWRYFLKTC